VAKDAVMACVVMAIIIAMSLVLGAELGSKANPTTRPTTPRPEWYFFFLFEVLRVIKPPSLVPLATIGVPTLGMILLFLLPFYDRGPERRPGASPDRHHHRHLRDRCDGLPDLLGRQRGHADGDRNGHAEGGAAAGGAAVAEYNEGKARGRPVGLRGVPQDRRQRQQRPRARPDAHRPPMPTVRDRAHAGEPDGADAVVQEPAGEEVQRVVDFLSQLK
jgi:hypothetical protein